MFGFGKKKDKLDKEDKEKRKREKKERKLAGNAEAGSRLTSDDLNRLEDIRRSFKLGKSEKLPSGIVADYRDSAFLATDPNFRDPFYGYPFRPKNFSDRFSSSNFGLVFT
jgi:hypothetical protein